jgi:hypothetical protein
VWAGVRDGVGLAIDEKDRDLVSVRLDHCAAVFVQIGKWNVDPFHPLRRVGRHITCAIGGALTRPEAVAAGRPRI